jgi:hypothetical protein
VIVPAEKALRGRLEKLTPATSAADINFIVLRLVSSVIVAPLLNIHSLKDPDRGQ